MFVLTQLQCSKKDHRSASSSASIILRLSDSATHLSRGDGINSVIQAINRCIQYPLVQQSNPKYFSEADAHSFLEATVHDLVIFDKLLSTYIGFTERISILFEYSIYKPCDIQSLSALVALQREIQGIGYQAAIDDRLIIALLFSLFSIRGIAQWLIITIGITLTEISSLSLLSAISWNLPMLDMPTLLTRMETSSVSSCAQMAGKKSQRLLLVKSAIMVLVYISLSSCTYRMRARAASILLLFLAIMQMLNPKAASSQQKPSPMPSLPPVTTAHERRPQRSGQFLAGRIALMRLHSSLEIQIMNTRPPITARKQMKLRVDWSIDLKRFISDNLPNIQ